MVLRGELTNPCMELIEDSLGSYRVVLVGTVGHDSGRFHCVSCDAFTTCSRPTYHLVSAFDELLLIDQPRQTQLAD